MPTYDAVLRAGDEDNCGAPEPYPVDVDDVVDLVADRSYWPNLPKT